MVPTLQVRDVLLVDEIAYRLHRPSVGEVAVFTPPLAAGGNDYVKRVIGAPGDTITVSNGVVYRNGVGLHERYENEAPTYDLAIRQYGIYVNGSRLDWRAHRSFFKGWAKRAIADHRHWSEELRAGLQRFGLDRISLKRFHHHDTHAANAGLE